MAILPQVSMPFVRLLYKFWLNNGVPKQALDDVLGIDISIESGDKFGISSHKMVTLHQTAVKEANDSALGIRLGQHIAITELAIGNIVMKSSTLAAGLEALMTHSMMVSESGRFELTDISAESVRLAFVPVKGVLFSCYQKDMVFAAVNNWILNIFPDAVESIKYFYDTTEVSGIEHENLIGNSAYKAGDTYIEISRSLLGRENPYSDKEIFEQNLAQAKKIMLKRMQRLELYAAVRSEINECLLQRCATQDTVAKKLNLSVRNLQRRLKEAGTTYQAILDDSREVLALHLIKNLNTPLYEISFLIGFTEPSAFYKAFRRWTGKRPGDYRQDVVEKAEPSIINEKIIEEVVG